MLGAGLEVVIVTSVELAAVSSEEVDEIIGAEKSLLTPLESAVTLEEADEIIGGEKLSLLMPLEAS